MSEARRIPGASLAARLRAEPMLGLWGGIVVAIAIRNLAGLTTSPPGLYIDEASVGYNAYALGHTGRDEHGATLPLYPEAFGEYKNPVYIYTLALLSRLVGINVFVTRLPAAVLGLAACLFVAMAACRITRSHVVGCTTLALAGMTPWLTQESRLAFEVISMVALLALMIWCLTEAERHDDLRSAARWYAGAGGAAAVAIFAYSTARLEIGFFTVAIVVAFIFPWRKRWWAALGPIVAGYAVLGFWMLSHPGALTARYDIISITIDHATGRMKPLGAIWQMFWSNYWQYLSPSFLFTTGDGNIRHNTLMPGVGELLWPTAVLLIAGILWCLRHIVEPVPRFLLLCIPVAPIAASLTDNGTPHSLRAVDILPVLLVLGGIGVHCLAQCAAWALRRAAAVRPAELATPFVAGVTVLALLFFAIPYTADMYSDYPQRAADAFDSGGLDAFSVARQVAAGHTIYLVDDFADYQPYILAAFQDAPSIEPPSHAMENPQNYLLGQLGMVQVTTLTGVSLQPGDIIVAGAGDQLPANARLVAPEGVAAVYRVVSAS